MHESFRINSDERVPSITDLDDAKEYIKGLWESGIRPIVTVPREFQQYLNVGLKPHSTWIPGVEVIAATFGRKSYLPKEEDRIVVEIEISLEKIHPRFTGPDKAFHGVVILDGPIKPEEMTLH